MRVQGQQIKNRRALTLGTILGKALTIGSTILNSFPNQLGDSLQHQPQHTPTSNIFGLSSIVIPPRSATSPRFPSHIFRRSIRVGSGLIMRERTTHQLRLRTQWVVVGPAPHCRISSQREFVRRRKCRLPFLVNGRIVSWHYSGNSGSR